MSALTCFVAGRDYTCSDQRPIETQRAGSQEIHDHRVGVIFGRICLGDKQSSDEEWMLRQFHNSCFASLIGS
jgi:hypothetical protein